VLDLEVWDNVIHFDQKSERGVLAMLDLEQVEAPASPPGSSGRKPLIKFLGKRSLIKPGTTFLDEPPGCFLGP
jgi:hypothetical protein